MRVTEKTLAYIFLAVFPWLIPQQADGSLLLGSSLAVSERYNDNIFFTEMDTKDDFSTVVSPRLELSFSNKYFFIAGLYKGTLEFHSAETEEDSYTQRATFDLGFPMLSRQVRGLTVQVSETFSYTPELTAYIFQDLEEGVPAEEDLSKEPTDIGEGIHSGRGDVFKNRFGLLIKYKSDYYLEENVSYVNLLTRFKDKSDSDSVGHKLGAGLDYLLSLRTTITTSYNYSLTIFENKDEVQGHRFWFGARHKFSQILSANGSIGIAFIDQATPQFIIKGGVGRKYKRGGIQLNYRNDFGTAEGLTTSAVMKQRFRGQVTREIGRRNLATFYVGYGNTNSISGDALKSSSLNAGGGLRIFLLEWLRGEIRYNYLKQLTSEGTAEEATRNTVEVALKVLGPAWMIQQ